MTTKSDDELMSELADWAKKNFDDEQAMGLPLMVEFIVQTMWDHADNPEYFSEGIGYLVLDVMDHARRHLHDKHADNFGANKLSEEEYKRKSDQKDD